MYRKTIVRILILASLGACSHEPTLPTPPKTAAANAAPPTAQAVSPSTPPSDKFTGASGTAASIPASPAAAPNTAVIPAVPAAKKTIPGAPKARGDAGSAKVSTTQLHTAPSPQPASAVRPDEKSAPPPALDLVALEQRLRDTRAIGVFSKLSLKNQVDDLISQFRAFHSGHSGMSLTDLRQRYDLLLIKVLTLLQDGDPPLASAISVSREAIWAVLADRDKFQKFQLS